MVATPVLQFGTSRLMQAHADLFLDEAGGGPVTVVQTSGDPSRAGRLAALARPEGFPVRIRGLVDGQAVDREQRVRSVARALSTATDWPEVRRVMVEEAGIVLSNAGDAGWRPAPADGGAGFDQAMSFPAKLLHLLLARFEAGGRPVQVMPLELVADNGAVLRARILDLAAGRPAATREWLADGVVWASSLVDRIVSAPLEPAGAVAEPYALWAIQARPGLVAPCAHPCVQVVERLEDASTLKLFILNLGHTVLADAWLRGAAPPLVREALEAPAGQAMREALEAEVIPGFAAAGREAEARAYLAATLDRFANPFLDHRLSDIAENHADKVERRVRAFVAWARAAGDPTPKPRLEAVASRAGAPA